MKRTKYIVEFKLETVKQIIEKGQKRAGALPGVAVVSHLRAHITPELGPILARIDCSQVCCRPSVL